MRKRAFTLAEIMVAVAIFGILMSIAMPWFVRARLKAREVELIQDLRVLRDAVEQYNAVYRAYPWNLGWLTHSKIGGPASGYDVSGNLVSIPTYATRFKGPFIRMHESKRWVSPYFGSHGEWFPMTAVPGTTYEYTGSPNSRGEYVWVSGAGTTLDGTPYIDL